MAAPRKKKAKCEETEWEVTDKILLDLENNEGLKENLRNAISALTTGHSRACVRLLEIESHRTNARGCESFTRASCPTKSSKRPPFSLGTIFSTGLKVLEKYVDENEIPTHKPIRNALKKLMLFITTSVASIKRPKKDVLESQWAVQLAQHLFSQLAVQSKHVIDNHYHCEKHDTLTGSFGDTSFGCPDAWHGFVDIMFENSVAIQVTEAGDDKNEDESDYSDCGNDSSVEVKIGANFGDSSQILSQCIVFSFLQRMLNEEKMDNFLVPSLAVNTKALVISLYDSKNDILLQSAEIPLFDPYDGLLDRRMIVCVWLAMNYRLFCSGITEDMKGFRARFHEEVGSDLNKYLNTVTKPYKPLVSDEPTPEFEWFESVNITRTGNPPRIQGGFVKTKEIKF